MIAQPTPCQKNRLGELLEDRLSPAESDRLQSHLSHCESCQHDLERLAGGDGWWSETEAALSAADTPGPANGRSPVDIETAWLRSLLEPPSRPGDWGRIAGYHISGLVGQGGMGVVLRGWDPQLNRHVAVKLLLPHLATSGAARSRFLREAQSAAAVVHASVIPIFAVSSDGPLPLLVMPLVAGGNLQQRIDREGPLEPEDVLQIGLQIAEGLAAAHRQGVVHRDIKPANILLEDASRRVVISDFGLARALDDATITASGMIAGTPQYMSPEQALGESVDNRADLYSLGGVLYAIATGRPPIASGPHPRMLRDIGTAARPSVHEVNERMPAWFDSIVCRLMEPDPNKRIQTADEVAALLQQCLIHLRAPSRIGLPRSLQRRVLSARRLWAGGAAVALVIGVFTAAMLLPNGQPAHDAPFPSSAGPLERETEAGEGVRFAPVVGSTREFTPGDGAEPLGTVEPVEARELEQQLWQLETEIEHLELELQREQAARAW